MYRTELSDFQDASFQILRVHNNKFAGRVGGTEKIICLLAYLNVLGLKESSPNKQLCLSSNRQYSTYLKRDHNNTSGD